MIALSILMLPECTESLAKQTVRQISERKKGREYRVRRRSAVEQKAVDRKGSGRQVQQRRNAVKRSSKEDVHQREFAAKKMCIKEDLQ